MTEQFCSTHDEGEKVITLEIGGEKEEYRFGEETTHEEIVEFVDSRMGIESESPNEVEHPSLEFAELDLYSSPEPDGLRCVCYIEGCAETDSFNGLRDIKRSGWTELGMPKGILTDGTELHYAYCPSHSLNG